MRGRSWLPLLPILVGCWTRFPPCPSSGGPAWRELVSEHFRLRTDLDRDGALETVVALEELRAALLIGFAAQPGVPSGRLPVIALDHGWGEVASADIGGFFGNVLFEPLVVIHAGSALAQERIIKHELVHFFSRKVMPVQPRWFAEGLASYFETITYDADDRRITVGRPPSDLLSVVQRGALVDTKTLFSTTEIHPDDRNVFYPTAWLAMHFLMNHRHDALVQYELALARKPADSDAWTHAFPDLSEAKLDEELRTYLDGGQYELLIFPFKPPATRIVAERTLEDADVHATRAFLLAASGLDGSLHRSPVPKAEIERHAEQEAGEALREAPGHPLAQAVRTWMLGDKVDLDQARVASREHPADWMAWLLVAQGLQQRGIAAGQREALDRATALAAEDGAVTLE